MFEGRVNPQQSLRRKPKLILNQRFPFSSDMELGEKGQLDVTVLADRERLDPDEEGNEFKVVEFKLIRAEKIDPRKMRV